MHPCIRGVCASMHSWSVCIHAFMECVHPCIHGVCAPMHSWSVCIHAFMECVHPCIHGVCVSMHSWSVCIHAFMECVHPCIHGVCAPMHLWIVYELQSVSRSAQPTVIPLIHSWLCSAEVLVLIVFVGEIVILFISVVEFQFCYCLFVTIGTDHLQCIPQED